MAPASFENLRLDAVDVDRMAAFLGPAPDLRVERAGGTVLLRGSTTSEMVRLTAVPEPKTWGIEQIPGAPFVGLAFATVPEPKTGTNRVHLDLGAAGSDALVDHGATLLPRPARSGRWAEFADPERNEFCVVERD